MNEKSELNEAGIGPDDEAVNERAPEPIDDNTGDQPGPGEDVVEEPVNGPAETAQDATEAQGDQSEGPALSEDVEAPPPAGSPVVELPRYQCHKQVCALKIAGIVNFGNGDAELVFDDGYAPIGVSKTWIEKHSPQSGGYYVVYDDGYQSYSPAEPFESGYSLIADELPPAA